MLTGEMHAYSVKVMEGTRTKTPQNIYLEITLFNKYNKSINIVDCDLFLHFFVNPNDTWKKKNIKKKKKMYIYIYIYIIFILL